MAHRATLIAMFCLIATVSGCVKDVTNTPPFRPFTQDTVYTKADASIVLVGHGPSRISALITPDSRLRNYSVVHRSLPVGTPAKIRSITHYPSSGESTTDVYFADIELLDTDKLDLVYVGLYWYDQDGEHGDENVFGLPNPVRERRIGKVE